MVGPLRQDPAAVPKPKKEKALPPILQGSAPAPAQEPKKERHASVSGFVENALDDAWDLAKGLYEIIPSTVKSYQQNIPYIFKNRDLFSAGLVAGAAKETAKDIGKAIIEPYQKHGAGVVYQRPVTVLSDFITVLTLGGGSIKNAGKLAKASGYAEKGQKLIEAGRWLEQLPAKMGRKAVDSTVKAATGGKLDLGKRREFLAIKAEEQGRRIKKIEEDAKNVLEKIDALDPSEKEIFHKARTLGDVQGYGVPDAALTPKTKAALDAYTDLVNRVDPSFSNQGITDFYKSRGFLNEATAEATIHKKFALEAFDDVSKESIAKAKELIDQAKAQGRRLPVYGQNVFVDEMGKLASADTVLDDLITGGRHVKEGKINPLEKMAGAKGYSKDPSIYAREMIRNFRQTEAKTRLSERLLEEKALIKGGAGGMTAEGIPEGIHRKYYEDRIRAEALKSITDPTIQRLLRWEYTKNNSSIIRIYDRIHGLFAKMATKYNPKWVTGNVVGDAVLGLLAGSDWTKGAKYLKRGAMPAQVAAKNVTLSTQDVLNQPGRLAQAVGYLPEKASDLAGYIDQATRAGIISKEVGRRLKEAGISFEAMAEQFEQVLRSTDRFSDVQVQMRLLSERIERGSPEVLARSKKLAALEDKEAALHSKLEDIDFSRRVAALEKAGSAKNLVLREEQRALKTYEAKRARIEAQYKREVASAQNDVVRQVAREADRYLAFQQRQQRLADTYGKKVLAAKQDYERKLSRIQKAKESHEAKNVAVVGKHEERRAAIEQRISEIEREAKGGRRIQEISEAMDSLKRDGEAISRAIAEAKAGSKRALSESEKDLIHSFGGQILSPEVGLIGRRGKRYAESLADRIQPLQSALAKVKQKYEALRREGKALAEAFYTERAALVRQLKDLGEPRVSEFVPPQAAEKVIPKPEGATFEAGPVTARQVPAPDPARMELDRVRAARESLVRAKSDLPLGATGDPLFEKGISKLQDIRQGIVNLHAENSAVIRDVLDDMAKRGDLERLVPGLREQVAIVRPAVERANAFIGDYLALDGFEQGVLRRVIPFYPWARAMSMLAFRLPFLAPVKVFAWNRFSDALMTLVDDPELPDDFRGRVPVSVTQDGKTVWAKVTAYSPFESLKTSHIGGMPVPSMANIVERNPFISLGFQIFGGKTIWDASTLPYGEPMVSIGDGTVMRVKPNGKVEKEIPQAPLVSSIMHTFPTTQLVQQVLVPYWTNKYDWAGFPEPVLNSDGSYKYPRALWDRLGAAVGLNLQTRSREDVIRARKVKAVKAVNEMKSALRRTNDEDEREMIMNAIQDTISQEIHGRRP